MIMGLRHRKYTVEAVQYHPESILSEGGDDLIRNFLSLKGGSWAENPEARVLDNTLPPFPIEALPKEVAAKPGVSSKLPTILEKIYAQRLSDVAQAQSTPGSTLADLETLYSLNISPPLIPFVPRIKRVVAPNTPSLFAEIKRASPSKGHISVSTSPPQQALTYALSGAHVISVLTEPKWFLGSLADMLHARTAVASLPDRPAILRKDFILNRYQVLESRIWGADTILLIVSMLPEDTLRDLYEYSVSLGMEPLVEVNNAKEMEIALSLPAKVIGVNNRNLHDFQVDMNTTTRLSDMVKDKDIILLALSGISTPDDVTRFSADGVGGVLIGESLMRAKDPAAFIRELLSLPKVQDASGWKTEKPLVKICGVRSKGEALAIAQAGADLIGLVFAPKSKRVVSLDAAKEISQAIRVLRFNGSTDESNSGPANAPWFTTQANRVSLSNSSRPLLVGVFQNASLEEVLRILSQVQLDIVQLHGSEPVDWAHQIPVPVIKAFHVGKDGRGLEEITRPGAHKFVLLDSIREDGSGQSGGSGKVVDWNLAKKVVDDGELLFKGESAAKKSLDFPFPIILAGGLSPANVSEAISLVHPWVVDVSGGVENEDGTAKDINLVQAFVNAAKGIQVEAKKSEDSAEEEEVEETTEETSQ